MSARNHHHSLRNYREERNSHLLRGGSLQSHKANICCVYCPSFSYFYVFPNGEINKGNRILVSNLRESDAIREGETKESVESEISKEKLTDKKKNRFCSVEMWSICFV
jgi:hypothetical protein